MYNAEAEDIEYKADSGQRNVNFDSEDNASSILRMDFIRVPTSVKPTQRRGCDRSLSVEGGMKGQSSVSRASFVSNFPTRNHMSVLRLAECVDDRATHASMDS